MDTITITSRKPFVLQQIVETLSPHWTVEKSIQDTIVIHTRSGRAYIHLESGGHEHYRLLIDYSDVELAKRLIQYLADSPDTTVDNDFGLVLPGNDFVAKCKREKDWDWRQ